MSDETARLRFIKELGKAFDADAVNHPRRIHKFDGYRNADTETVLNHYLKFLSTSGDAILEAQNELDREGEFDVSNSEDGRKKVQVSIALRRGQPKFRRQLVEAYQGKCAVTGTAIIEILEAAHIVPYNGDATDDVRNGLLLRADIHALFDLGLLSIEPTELRIYCSESIRRDAVYGALHGRVLATPLRASQRPNRKALQMHYEKRLP